MKIELGQVTAHPARFLAESQRADGGGLDALIAALFDPKVDLHPHQIEAALVGVGAASERGRLLADEVGPGRTIEAALLLCQRLEAGAMLTSSARAFSPGASGAARPAQAGGWVNQVLGRRALASSWSAPPAWSRS